MKFQVYQSYWGMSSLPFGGEEWSMEEKLAKIAEADFDGVEWLMEEQAHREAMVPLCDKYNLKTIYRRPKTAVPRISICSRCRCRGWSRMEYLISCGLWIWRRRRGMSCSSRRTATG